MVGKQIRITPLITFEEHLEVAKIFFGEENKTVACMEHFCTRCDWFDMDNTRGPGKCPKCGAPVNHTFDEPPEREYDHHDEEPEDDE